MRDIAARIPRLSPENLQVLQGPGSLCFVGPVGYRDEMGWQDSSARSRELGEQLRNCRKATGTSGAELAHQLGWSASKVSRIESGQVQVTEVDAAIYLTTCGVRQPELDSLLKLARMGDDRTWLQERGTRLPDELRTLVFHEATARTITTNEPLLVPGLLQTAAYAHALFGLTGLVPTDRIPIAVETRMARQAVLRTLNPPKCVFYLHEYGLRSKVGSNKIMRDQILQLVFLTSRPQHEIRVVLGDSGPLGAWGNPFVLMGYDLHGPVAFVEGVSTGLFMEKPAHIAAFQEVLGRLDRVALDEEQSRQWLARLASDFNKPEVGPDA